MIVRVCVRKNEIEKTRRTAKLRAPVVQNRTATDLLLLWEEGAENSPVSSSPENRRRRRGDFAQHFPVECPDRGDTHDKWSARTRVYAIAVAVVLGDVRGQRIVYRVASAHENGKRRKHERACVCNGTRKDTSSSLAVMYLARPYTSPADPTKPARGPTNIAAYVVGAVGGPFRRSRSLFRLKGPRISEQFSSGLVAGLTNDGPFTLPVITRHLPPPQTF